MVSVLGVRGVQGPSAQGPNLQPATVLMLVLSEGVASERVGKETSPSATLRQHGLGSIKQNPAFLGPRDLDRNHHWKSVGLDPAEEAVRSSRGPPRGAAMVNTRQRPILGRALRLRRVGRESGPVDGGNPSAAEVGPDDQALNRDLDPRPASDRCAANVPTAGRHRAPPRSAPKPRGCDPPNPDPKVGKAKRDPARARTQGNRSTHARGCGRRPRRADSDGSDRASATFRPNCSAALRCPPRGCAARSC